jgi:hypothetical protein
MRPKWIWEAIKLDSGSYLIILSFSVTKNQAQQVRNVKFWSQHDAAHEKRRKINERMFHCAILERTMMNESDKGLKEDFGKLSGFELGVVFADNRFLQRQFRFSRRRAGKLTLPIKIHPFQIHSNQGKIFLIQKSIV